MTVMKNYFSLLNGTDNPLFGVILEVNAVTSGFLVYGLLFFLFVVSTWVFMRRTQDIGKSMLSSVHVVVIIGLLLFYMGKTQGVVLVSDVFMLALLVVEALALAGIYYFRSNN